MQDILLFNDTTQWYHFGCTATSLALKQRLIEKNCSITAIPTVRLIINKSAPKKDLENPKHFDMWIKVAIINHSVFPEDFASLYDFVYSSIDFIAVRETISFEILKELKIENVVQSFDCLPLFLHDHPISCENPVSSPIVITSGHGITKEALPSLCTIITKLQKEGHDIEILLGAKAYPSLDEMLFAKLILEKNVPNLKIHTANNLFEWLEHIKCAKLVLSGRFHHAIAAFCLNKPLVTIQTSTPKIDALSRMLKIPSPCDLREDGTEKIHHAIQQALASPAPQSDFKRLVALAEKNFLFLE